MGRLHNIQDILFPLEIMLHGENPNMLMFHRKI